MVLKSEFDTASPRYLQKKKIIQFKFYLIIKVQIEKSAFIRQMIIND